MKDTFIVRTEWWNSISQLEKEERAEIIRLLFLYHLEEPNFNLNNLENLNNLSVKLVWGLIEPNLKRNITAYNDKRSFTSKENGKLGGRPSKSKNKEEPNKPNKPNVTLSVSDSVSVSVSDSDSDIKKTKSNSIFENSILISINEISDKIFETEQFRLFFENNKLSESLAKDEFKKFVIKRKISGDSIINIKDFWNHFLNTFMKQKEKQKEIPFNHLKSATAADHLSQTMKKQQ